MTTTEFFTDMNDKSMKPFALYLLMAALVVLAGACSKNRDAQPVLSKYDVNRPVGFGADVTGGAVVTTAGQLKDAVSGVRAATVYVRGEISLDATIPVGSNKSIIGLPGARISNLHRDENAGIFLVKEMCDDVHYERRGDMNILTIVKKY